MQGGEVVQFRPTIVLCLGAEGKAVGEWLNSLLPSLAVPLREGMALLAADSPAVEGERLAGFWLDDEPPNTQAGGANEPPNTQAGGANEPPNTQADGANEPPNTQADGDQRPPVVALATRIIEALRGRRVDGQSALRRRGVLDDAVISRIKEAGYSVPRGMVAVWIVAAADSPVLTEAVTSARTALRSEGVEGWILLALINSYPLDPEEHQQQEHRCAAQPWDTLLVGSATVPPPVTFTYLFETHDERGLFWEGPDDTSFAAAEAIFTLSATGLTLTREYQETLRRSMPRMVTVPQERMSSVATSRLTFPRAQAERYCAYQLGASILGEWMPAQEARLSREDDRAQAARAASDFQRIARETRSSNALIAALRRSVQQRSRRRAHENELPPDGTDSRLVLRVFSQATVMPTVTPQFDLPTALQVQRQLAEDGYNAWEEALIPAWQHYADDAAKDIATHADELTLEGALGVERAYAYVFAFNEALRDELELLDTQQARRIARRTRDLAALEAASQGPWLADLPTDVAETPHETEGQREERITVCLGERWRWIHNRQPALMTLIAAATLAAATLALLALLLAPTSWLRSPLTWAPLLLAPAVVAGLITWGYAYHRRKREQDAADDLFRHYRGIYRYRIEKREADWRETVFAMLRTRCESMLDRLADWERFIEEITSELSRDADAEESRLFDGAYGRRDVLVANRKRLRRDGYTLRDFALDVSKRRQAQPQPETPWHASNRALLVRLRDALHGHVSLVEASAASIATPVRDYCAGIVQPYLTGELVNLSDALEAISASENTSMLEALLERATLLYHPIDQPRAAASFVAARDADLASMLHGKQLTGLISLGMREREWLAVTRLLPGGARPDFLRDRAETTQAPLELAPEWIQRRGIYQNGAASQNGGSSA